MDIYSYLEKDHEKVSHLFKQLEKSPSPQHKIAIMEFIIRELTVHAESESATFYAALKEFDESKDEAEHGQKEHEEIEALMQQIKKAIKEKKDWEKLANKLKEEVEHHVKEEEGPMFKKAKEVLNRDEEFILTEKMHYLKGKLLDNMHVESITPKESKAL